MATIGRLAVLLAAFFAVGWAAPAGEAASEAASEAAFVAGLHADLLARATNQSPSGYAPSHVDCPATRPRVRDGSSLSPQEAEWLPRRRNETIAPMRALLKRLAIPGFDVDKYLAGADKDPTALPNVGLAVSGGGYRAMLNGAGALAAWDIRSTGSDAAGNLGGLLQSATYLSGLSGGSWLVGSLYANNFTSVQEAVRAPGIWRLEDSIFTGPAQYSLIQYYRTILDQVARKGRAGFDTSVTDVWGRMLSYQLIGATDGGPGHTFSSVAHDADFAAGRTPLPLIVAVGRAPGEKIVSSNSTVFEFNPWEMGSHDPSLRGFVPLRHVGSRFADGVLDEDASSSPPRCVVGFDNAGFVMGTSSSLFNQMVLYLRDGKSDYVPDDVPGFVVDAVAALLDALGAASDDVADWSPNPFRGWNPARNPGASSARLTLVDGGEDLQNIPYHPHLVPARGLDVVFSVDSSADTDTSWPDGTAPIATYERSLRRPAPDGSSFPPVPGRDTFRNLGLNARPAFFGCDAANLTLSSAGAPPPLIVYIPNHPYVYHSNISTFQMAVPTAQRDAIIQNGWAVATQLNSTRDPDWPACVACAMLARSFARTRAVAVPEKCNRCFARYCWDGTLNETKPAAYAPDYVARPLGAGEQSSRAGRRSVGGGGGAAAAAVSYLSMFLTTFS